MKEIKCFLVGLCVIFTGVIQAQTGAISGVVGNGNHITGDWSQTHFECHGRAA